jgi:thioredoxin-like negative regulator of GroEL
MDNEQNHNLREGSATPAEPALKRRKPEKPQFADFLGNWWQALASQKDPVPKLRSMVRAGFQGEISGEQVSQLLASLAEHGTVAERLALHLAVQERAGKLRPLARRLLAELRTSFENKINYIPEEFSGYRAPHVIEDWVAEHAPSVPAEKRDSWFRRFVVCLLKQSEPKTVVVGLVAASRRWAASKGLNSSAEEASFIRGIALALSAPVISAGKLELILAGVMAVEEQFQQMLNRELSLEREIRMQQDSIAALNRRASGLESSLAAALADADEKNARISELEQLLSEAGERYDLLDRHWRGVFEQELTKQRVKFRELIGPELVEALLALNRDNPNVEIALRRLHHIQKILDG